MPAVPSWREALLWTSWRTLNKLRIYANEDAEYELSSGCAWRCLADVDRPLRALPRSPQAGGSMHSGPYLVVYSMRVSGNLSGHPTASQPTSRTSLQPDDILVTHGYAIHPYCCRWRCPTFGGHKSASSQTLWVNTQQCNLQWFHSIAVPSFFFIPPARHLR